MLRGPCYDNIVVVSLRANTIVVLSRHKIPFLLFFFVVVVSLQFFNFKHLFPI